MLIENLSYHHCSILEKHNLTGFDNYKNFKYACSVYKILHGLVLPPLNKYFRLRANSGTTTRATTRGNCEVPHRCLRCLKIVRFGITYCLQYMNVLHIALSKTHLKQWLKTNQNCNAWLSGSSTACAIPICLALYLSHFITSYLMYSACLYTYVHMHCTCLLHNLPHVSLTVICY